MEKVEGSQGEKWGKENDKTVCSKLIIFIKNKL